MRNDSSLLTGCLLLVSAVLFVALMPVLFAVFNIFAIPMIAGPSYVLGKALDNWFKNRFR